MRKPDHQLHGKARVDSYLQQCKDGRPFNADHYVELQCAEQDARKPTMWERIFG